MYNKQMDVCSITGAGAKTKTEAVGRRHPFPPATASSDMGVSHKILGENHDDWRS